MSSRVHYVGVKNNGCCHEIEGNVVEGDSEAGLWKNRGGRGISLYGR